MPILRAQKEEQVKNIQNLLSKAHSIIVWDYLGLSASEISDLRSKISKVGAINTVYKNRVTKIAFEANNKKEILEYLTGPSSFLFIMDDSIDSIKAILEVARKTEGKIQFKAGYIDGIFYDANGVTEIASLPSKDELLSMLLSVLQANLRNLVYLLIQVSKKITSNDLATEEHKTLESVDKKEIITEKSNIEKTVEDKAREFASDKEIENKKEIKE